MRALYQKFLFGAGKAVKSNNKLANCYGRFIVYILSTIFHIQKYNDEELVQEVETFHPNASEEEKKKIIKETKKAYFKYRCTALEYFVFDLKNKSKKEIKDYLFDIEKIVLINFINSKKDLTFFNNKQKCYEKLKEYYKRDVIYMKNSSDSAYEDFKRFAEAHHEFIVKSSNLSCGRGITVFKLKDEDLTDDSLQRIYREIEKNTPVVIEEFMHNDSATAAYYDKALNIMRVVVFKTKEGELVIPHCYHNFAVGGQEFANNHVGSIAVMLDPKTGAAISNGITFTSFPEGYEKHPDSGLSFKDFKVDNWDEMLDLVQKLSDALPSVKYVGWDLALTTKGWCVVEGNGNGGQTFFQLMEKKSIRETFMKCYNLT